MADGSATGELRNQLNTLTQVGVVGDVSDAQLLQRFLSGPDGPAQAAFAALVARHGPMVLRVCHQVLGDRHHAEDAFQATFLVLASKADSVRKADSLASWLHGVALRVGARAKADGARRRAFERRSGAIRTAWGPREEGRSDSWPELHEEIDRLPECYREPVVLHYLEGMSAEATALRIGCPRGTVLSRLSRARERLRRRLSRRGLVVPAALLAADLMPAAAGSVLVHATVRVSLKFAGRRVGEATLASTTAITLARGMIYAMTISKLKTLGAAAVIFAVGGIVGAVVLAGGHDIPRALAQDTPPARGSSAPLPELPDPAVRPGPFEQIDQTELPPPAAPATPAAPPLPAVPQLPAVPPTPAAPPTQARLRPPVQRYQISAWSHPAATSDTGGFIAPSHGAYILDTQSGKVWQVKEGQKPKLLGSVE